MAEARSLVVTTTADVVDANDGLTSLREAVAYANDVTVGGTGDADGDGDPNDTVEFAANLAGRVVALPPRLQVPDDFTLVHYLAAGLAVLQTATPTSRVDLAAMADELDAEAFRNSAGHQVFTNPAKSLADRMSGREVVFAGDSAATEVLARHAGTVMLRLAHKTVSAVGLADVLVAIGTGWGRDTGAENSIFHDEELDGPLPRRTRTFVLTTDADRPAVAARLTGFDDVHVVASNDVPEVAVTGEDQDVPVSAPVPGIGCPEQQLALLAVRIEMAAVYQRLIRG